jgi:hypothetical protein
MVEKVESDKKVVEEVKVDERRSFLGSDEKAKYFIASPTAEDIRGADWAYSKMYTQSLVEGITTSSEMIDILNRRGIIGPEFEKRAKELAESLAVSITTLEASTNLEEKRELAISVAQAREELFQWNQRLNGPLNNSCEQIADDARLEFLTSCIIQNEQGEKIWDKHDTYLREKNQALAIRSRFEVMLFLQGLESNFLEMTPESRALKEIETDVMDKAKETLKALKIVEAEKKEMIEEKSKKKTRKSKKSK